MTEILKFSIDDLVVYPARGVGRITAIETQEHGEVSVQLYVISFDHDKMTVRVPTSRAKALGLRGLSSRELFEKAMHTLTIRKRAAKGAWGKRAKEYETKINSGSLVSIAEVVREVHPKEGVEDTASFSERQVYHNAIEHLIREMMAIEDTSYEDMRGRTLKALNPG